MPQQITYLKALSHLSSTHVYNVNFKRGTKIQYGDRNHCLLSGTASIDAHGNIVAPGNPVRQMERTLENIEALLHEGGMTFKDMRHIIVYLRDSHEVRSVIPILRQCLHESCTVNIVKGAVCRPRWLVEVEGMALCGANNPDFLPYCCGI